MRRLQLLLAGASLLLVLFGLALASRLPDGLDHISGQLGFPSHASPVRSVWASLAGIALVFGFGVLLGRTVIKRRK